MTLVLPKDSTLRADLDHILETHDVHRSLMGQAYLVLLFLGSHVGFQYSRFFLAGGFLSTGAALLALLKLIQNILLALVPPGIILLDDLGEIKTIFLKRSKFLTLNNLNQSNIFRKFAHIICIQICDSRILRAQYSKFPILLFSHHRI